FRFLAGIVWATMLAIPLCSQVDSRRTAEQRKASYAAHKSDFDYLLGDWEFSWSADGSPDGGQTWTKDFQRIEAHRIGPPRNLGPLSPAKKP
ncbi:MAG TPA: hypothetical protein VHZ55_10120, partial [Bryobacteraceae bacterium]|nr:hypothetical protein [Bryobacteraceae bacterium]